MLERIDQFPVTLLRSGEQGEKLVEPFAARFLRRLALDSSQQPAHLRNFVCLAPCIRHEKRHQNRQPHWQRFQMVGHRTYAAPGNGGEANCKRAEQKQGG